MLDFKHYDFVKVMLAWQKVQRRTGEDARWPDNESLVPTIKAFIEKEQQQRASEKRTQQRPHRLRFWRRGDLRANR